MKKVLKFIISLLCCYLVAVAVNYFFFDHIVVSGSSMNPTLSNGEFGISDKLVFKLTGLNRFDVVVIEIDDDKLVKRIVGLPNEKITYKNGILFVNDKVINENFINEINTYDNFEVTLAANEYFVLGDNRTNSLDSRNFGPIKIEDIKSKLFMINGICENGIVCDESNSCDCNRIYHFPRIVS